jgi:DNA mismatch endonuclease (patch repair protein)
VPDITLPKWKTVIFVHGCFWHGHGCKRGSAKRRPKTNRSYWNAKIEGNVKRDAQHARSLAKLGWRRLVIWACEAALPKKLEARLSKAFPADGPKQPPAMAARQFSQVRPRVTSSRPELEGYPTA